MVNGKNDVDEKRDADELDEPDKARVSGPGRFPLGVHAAVSNLFNLGRHLISAGYYRNLRTSAFAEWSGAVA